MTDARWIDVEDDVAGAARHFHNAGRLFDAGGFDDDDLDGYRGRMALQPAMQATYTSLEAALTKILDILGEDAPTGPSSHTDLLRRAAKSLDLRDRKRPAILPSTLVGDVDETRRFRHRATWLQALGLNGYLGCSSFRIGDRPLRIDAFVFRF